MGVTRIRLARFGRKNLPFYRIHVADSRCPRDGRHIEVLGTYNPLPVPEAKNRSQSMPEPTGRGTHNMQLCDSHSARKDGMKRITINSERAKYWLSVGAQPSETVAKLLGKIGILPPTPRPSMGERTSPPTKTEGSSNS